jgi:hypothetical protein
MKDFLKDILNLVADNWMIISPILAEILLRVIPTKWNLSIVDNVVKLIGIVIKNRRSPDASDVVDFKDSSINKVIVERDRHIISSLLIGMVMLSSCAWAQNPVNATALRLVNVNDSTTMTTNPIEATLYFNKQSHKPRFYYGGSWHDIATSNGSAPPFADNLALIKNNIDNTKLARFSASNISSATTRIYDLANFSGQLMTTNGTTTIGSNSTTAFNIPSGTTNSSFKMTLTEPTVSDFGLRLQSSNTVGSARAYFEGSNNDNGVIVGTNNRITAAPGGLWMGSKMNSTDSLTLFFAPRLTVGAFFPAVGVIQDTRSVKQGLVYAASGYVTNPRSLTDKGYVDAGFWKTGGTTTLTSTATVNGGANSINLNGASMNVVATTSNLFVTAASGAETFAANTTMDLSSGGAMTATPTGIFTLNGSDDVLINSAGFSDGLKLHSTGAGVDIVGDIAVTIEGGSIGGSSTSDTQFVAGNEYWLKMLPLGGNIDLGKVDGSTNISLNGISATLKVNSVGPYPIHWGPRLSTTQNFASTASLAETTIGSITLSGASVGDVCMVSAPASVGVFTCLVTGTNTISITFHNTTSAAVDPASGSYQVVLMK